MKVPIYNQEGTTTKSISLSKNWQKLSVSTDLIHQVVRVEGLNQRRAWAKAKDRSEVSGGGRKPWRQKGTGRARHGSNRSPIWRGGGVAFGPNQEKKLHKKVNKKMKRLALIGIIKEKLADKNVVILENIQLAEPKTKILIAILKKILPDGNYASLLLIVEKLNKNLRLAAKNIKRLEVVEAKNLSAGRLIKAKKVLITKTAFDQLIR